MLERVLRTGERRVLAEEVLVVLALSLLASAVYAVLDLLSAPVTGVAVASVDQSARLSIQLAYCKRHAGCS